MDKRYVIIRTDAIGGDCMNEEWVYVDKNKPQRPPMSEKTKKKLIFILCAVIGVLIAVGGIYLWNTFSTGSDTPQEAVRDYLTASLVYDIDDMIRYSSDYNKTVLYGNQPTSDELLRAYLKKAYEGKESPYTESDIKVQLVASLEYNIGESKYDEIMEKYKQKDSDAEDKIEKIAIVEIILTKRDSQSTSKYLAVKSDGRWYYAYAGA